MLKPVRIYFLILLAVVISTLRVNATHLRAGDITVTRYSCSSYKFKITLHIYTRISSTVKFGGGTLNFGDGSKPHITEARPNPPQISPVDGGIGDVEYSVDHDYHGGGPFTITYYEQNRNEGILNISGSVNTPFFIQTQIIIDDFIGCNDSPQLLVPPIDLGCTGVAWFHNPGAYDPNGDSLSYELYVPKQGAVYDDNNRFASSIDVAGYQSPNSSAFSTTTETGVGAPVFKINPLTGTITWDCPGRTGEFNIAFIIREWRKVTGKWIPIGYVERDMQIIIQQCENNRPKLEVPPDVCVVAGTKVTGDVFATDPAVNSAARTKNDGDSTMIEAFSEVFSINPSPATYIPFPVVWQPTTSDSQQAHLKFSWQTQCAHVKEQPYEVVFKATDNGSPHLATFETWKIKVVAPAPLLMSADTVRLKRWVRLKWQAYNCKTDASKIEVWRRVDSAPFMPPTCVTGMPADLGYTLIDEVSPDSIGYTDKHIAAGAEYCYRLVALFPDGSESYVSQEVCVTVGPIRAKAPIITNVSIDVTDTLAGQVTVKWRPPFESNAPAPYSYEVYRAEGVSGNINLVAAFTGKRPDTVWVDTGLNTAQNVYNYRVLCFDNNNQFVDTSAVASTVRLELKPKPDQIQLSWNAVVPWSNNTIEYPIHLIYRSTNTQGKTLSDNFVLIDSVNVNQHQFTYLDSGQYDNTPLSITQDYCYAVMTRGSYGNPKIQAPLINFSEITCINLSENQPPCKPILVLERYNCDNFSTCPVEGTLYSNELTWKMPSGSNCQEEIRGYNIYAANSTKDSYTLIAALVRGTTYVHDSLPSYAQCYKISAVNRAGVESELSDPFCFDNCPYYELPNVFTPNGDRCNDKFSAFSIRNYGDPDMGYPCGVSDPDIDRLRSKCARFVTGVTFTVYNRWGRPVYNYQSGGENTIYIDWNGKDNNGRDLDSGVYYYLAEVVYDVVDPKQRNHTLKGWVQLIR